MRNHPTQSLDEGIWDVSELEEKVIKPNQWASVGARSFKAVSVTHATIPPGCYSVTKDNTDDRMLFVGKYIKSDEIMKFKNGFAEKLLEEINDFWSKREVFSANGFLHRRGYLLYGPQGTGKSSIVWQVAQDVIKRGGIVLVCDNPKFFAEGLKTLRLVEDMRPLVCVFEDIDAIISRYGETEILSILDGDNQVDRVINIATTNYPERLEKRIVSRPRRFDRIHKILAPEDDIRIAYLKEKLPKTEDMKSWVKETKGLSFAGLTEAVISVLCLGNDLKATVATIRDIESKNPADSDFGSGMGFNNDEDDDEMDPSPRPSRRLK